MKGARIMNNLKEVIRCLVNDVGTGIGRTSTEAGQ